MPTIEIRVLHPTDSSRVADGDADVELTMTDICRDLQLGEFLEPEHRLDQLGASLERTRSTLPMDVPLGTLGVRDGDAVALHKQTRGASS